MMPGTAAEGAWLRGEEILPPAGRCMPGSSRPPLLRKLVSGAENRWKIRVFVTSD